MNHFDIGTDPPRGAEALVSGDTLEVSWPAKTLPLRFTALWVGVVGGIALAVAIWFFFARWASLPLMIFLGVVVGGPLAWFASSLLLSRARVVLRVTPREISVRPEGTFIGPRRRLHRGEVLDVLVIEEQDGQNQDGEPTMVHRLVAPLKLGGRAVLVPELATSTFGHYVEACYAKWSKR